MTDRHAGRAVPAVLRRLALTAGAVAAGLVPGCERQPPAARGRLPETVRIAYVGPCAFDPAWPAIRGGARRRCAAVPYAQLALFAPPDTSGAALLRTVDEALAGRPDVVCLTVGPPQTTAEAAARIIRAGARLVVVGPDVPGVTPFARVAVNWADGAELLGESLAQIAPQRHSYVLVHGELGDPLSAALYYRFRLGAGRQTQLALLSERSASRQPGAARAAVRELLDVFPNVGLVVTLSAEPWLREPSDLTLGAQTGFATLESVPELWPALRAGRAVALVGPLHGEVGYAAADLGLASLLSPELAGTVRLIPCELVTPARLDDFAQRYHEAVGQAPQTAAAAAPGT